MKKIYLILSLLIAVHSYSQKKAKPVFTSINSVGAVWGSSQNVIVLQTINGWSYDKWFTGLGISFDSYGAQSTPIFIDVRRSTFNSKNIFVYTNAGINIPWRTTNFPKKYSWNNEDAFKLNNTFYGELGIGYKKLIANKSFFVVSLGYSYKHFSYVEQNVQTWGTGGASGKVDFDYDFYYKRIALRLGVQL